MKTRKVTVFYHIHNAEPKTIESFEHVVRENYFLDGKFLELTIDDGSSIVIATDKISKIKFGPGHEEKDEMDLEYKAMLHKLEILHKFASGEDKEALGLALEILERGKR